MKSLFGKSAPSYSYFPSDSFFVDWVYNNCLSSCVFLSPFHCFVPSSYFLPTNCCKCEWPYLGGACAQSATLTRCVVTSERMRMWWKPSSVHGREYNYKYPQTILYRCNTDKHNTYIYLSLHTFISLNYSSPSSPYITSLTTIPIRSFSYHSQLWWNVHADRTDSKATHNTFKAFVSVMAIIKST